MRLRPIRMFKALSEWSLFTLLIPQMWSSLFEQNAICLIFKTENT